MMFESDLPSGGSTAVSNPNKSNTTSSPRRKSSSGTTTTKTAATKKKSPPPGSVTPYYDPSWQQKQQTSPDPQQQQQQYQRKQPPGQAEYPQKQRYELKNPPPTHQHHQQQAQYQHYSSPKRIPKGNNNNTTYNPRSVETVTSLSADTNTNRMAQQQKPVEDSEVLQSLQREREGKCFHCGQRLFTIKTISKKSQQQRQNSNGSDSFGTESSNTPSSLMPPLTTTTSNTNHTIGSLKGIANAITGSGGVPTFAKRTNGLFLAEMSMEEYNKQYKRIPLTISGKVERGQCLLCTTKGINSTSVEDSTKNDPENTVQADLATTVEREFAHLLAIDDEEQNNNTINNGGGGGNAIYVGQYNAAGKRHGNGKMTWNNTGDVYIGEFVNGDRHGHGTIHFGVANKKNTTTTAAPVAGGGTSSGNSSMRSCSSSNSSSSANGEHNSHNNDIHNTTDSAAPIVGTGGEYVGDWRHNQMDGIGTRRWPNGDCYTGDYVSGHRTGSGRFYFANGDLYVGEFYSNKIHGYGRYYYANGQRFEGYFINGQRFGKGKIQRVDGMIDIGIYKNDVRVGSGIRWSMDRTETWKLENGIVKKKISVPEAVSLDYEMDTISQQLSEAMFNTMIDGEVL